MTMVRRIARDHCCGAIIDVQEFFLSQAGNRLLRSRIEKNMMSFARLLGYFRVPIVATLERPIYDKGFFDLTKENKIKSHLARLKKTQVIIVGCETDVCVLQSCLGLLALGYEVYVVEDLLFSSSRNAESAIARMKAEGAVFLTYKTLYYELIEAVQAGRHTEK